jgi:hypothetical protein
MAGFQMSTEGLESKHQVSAFAGDVRDREPAILVDRI